MNTSQEIELKKILSEFRNLFAPYKEAYREVNKKDYVTVADFDLHKKLLDDPKTFELLSDLDIWIEKNLD